MPISLFTALLLVAGFFLGCVGIHIARRHADVVTIGLVLLLGLTASLYVGRLSSSRGQHIAEQAGPGRVWTPILAHPSM